MPEGNGDIFDDAYEEAIESGYSRAGALRYANEALEDYEVANFPPRSPLPEFAADRVVQPNREERRGDPEHGRSPARPVGPISVAPVMPLVPEPGLNRPASITNLPSPGAGGTNGMTMNIPSTPGMNGRVTPTGVPSDPPRGFRSSLIGDSANGIDLGAGVTTGELQRILERSAGAGMLANASRGLVPAIRLLAPAGGRFLRIPAGRLRNILGGAEVIDLITPQIDLPSPSDVPGAIWQLIKGSGSVLTDLSGIALEGSNQMVDRLIGVTGEVIGEFLPDFGGNGGGTEFASPFVDGIFQNDAIVKHWVANGVPFWRLASGVTVVRRKNGTFRKFRQPKMIVLSSRGAPNVRALLRADKVIQRQTKQLSKLFNRRLPRPRRQPDAPRHTVPGVFQLKVDN